MSSANRAEGVAVGAHPSAEPVPHPAFLRARDRASIVPPELGWKALLPFDGAALEDQYRASLEKLGVRAGMLGVIFKGARCEIHNPALLKQLPVLASIVTQSRRQICGRTRFSLLARAHPWHLEAFGQSEP